MLTAGILGFMLLGDLEEGFLCGSPPIQRSKGRQGRYSTKWLVTRT